jgi:hypothetical protein
MALRIVVSHERSNLSLILLMDSTLSKGIPLAIVKANNDPKSFTLKIDYDIVNYYFKPKTFYSFLQYFTDTLSSVIIVER